MVRGTRARGVVISDSALSMNVLCLFYSHQLMFFFKAAIFLIFSNSSLSFFSISLVASFSSAIVFRVALA